jgi:hypothetical protein
MPSRGTFLKEAMGLLSPSCCFSDLAMSGKLPLRFFSFVLNRSMFGFGSEPLLLPLLLLALLFLELDLESPCGTKDGKRSVLTASGEFHDQGDAKWIVIRTSLWGHNDTPCG